MNDIQIAQSVTMSGIQTIADHAGINQETLSPYGRYIAKVDPVPYRQATLKAKLILVTAITPTPAGEGKTTVSIGLADGLHYNGKKAMLALREPSLGPVFGMKGGATGGGYAQVLPMEAINLHFTGDLHAITCANNLLAAMVDNHIQQDNALKLDPRKISIRRCMDMNERQLRKIISGLGGDKNGVPREDGFDITAASEVMAVFCLADDIADLKKRLARIVVGRDIEDKPVTCGQIGCQGAMAALLRDAIMPNLVQTIEGTPCLIHGGPFANIAHGCNSVIATKLAMKLADYVVTEAGFGADLGAEKFIDIKCRASGLKPDCVVLVATIRALKNHGGVLKADLGTENVEALKSGAVNLLRHIDNIQSVWHLPVVVAINHFSKDSLNELNALKEILDEKSVSYELCEGWAKGGEGASALAERVVKTLENADNSSFAFTYPAEFSLEEKIKAVATRIYRAGKVSFSANAKKDLMKLKDDGCSQLPVCIAKTQYSFSDNPKLVAAPEGFEITIRDVRLSAGAGFVVAFAGEIIAMPGLPKEPAALQIDVNDEGTISGLF